MQRGTGIATKVFLNLCYLLVEHLPSNVQLSCVCYTVDLRMNVCVLHMVAVSPIKLILNLFGVLNGKLQEVLEFCNNKINKQSTIDLCT